MISLYFDENILINDWAQNFYISPPTKSRVNKKINKKKLEIIFEPPYIVDCGFEINFSNTIKDFNEGNVLDSLILRYDNIKIDTSHKNLITGKLINSNTNEPLKNNWICLYDSQISDTLIFKDLPSYVTKSNEKGRFIFKNIKNGKYKIFSNENSFQEYHNNELVSFGDKFLNVKDSTNLKVLLKAFKNDFNQNMEKNLVDTTVNNNQIIVEFNRNKKFIVLLYDNGILAKKGFVKNRKCTINNIEKGRYEMFYFEDKDSNNFFTNGVFLKNQPELKIKFENPVKVLEDWVIELDIKVD